MPAKLLHICIVTEAGVVSAARRAIEMKPTLPPLDGAGKFVLNPNRGTLISFIALFLIIGIGCLMAVAQENSLQGEMIAFIFASLSGGYGLWFVYRALIHDFDLSTDDKGVLLGRRRYAWADIGDFRPGGKGAAYLSIKVNGKRRIISNMYGLAAPELADFLNGQLALYGVARPAVTFKSPKMSDRL
jgi:hypothetical protein